MSKGQRYRDSTLVRIGSVLLLVGSGPLVVVMLAATLGFTRDPRPNPVVFGMLAGLTFWPAVALIAFGVWRMRRLNRVV